MPLRRAISILVVFGIAFGYLEAAVVTYLRVLHEPARRHYYPAGTGGELFPLLTLEQVRAAEQDRVLSTEIGREAATMIMLASIAWAVASNGRQWLAAFAIVFGVWDIVFYAGLKLLIAWPASLLTWDILFLIPLPWVGPVVAPVLVASLMIFGGIWCLWRESSGRPVRARAGHVAGVLLGAFIVIVAFTLDYRNILAGGLPRPFHWDVFALGIAISAVSCVLAAVR